MFEGDYPDLGFDGGYSKDFRDTSFEEENYDSDDDNQDTIFLKGLVKVRDAAVKNRGSTVQVFEAFPAILHFSEWNLTDGCKQTVSVTNCSRKSQRFQIYSPTSQEFSAQYDKIGNLAPGMSQSITVKFSATELKYHHDTIRIEGEDSSLLIHLHGYPIANKVNFPRHVNFGNVQLCEPETQRISLSCSIPVDFSYDIKIIQSHPYFTVEPKRGIVPANGCVDFRIVFNPVTLGSCTLRLQLTIGQHGFVPLDCEVTGRSVSGLVESRQLLMAEKKVLRYLLKSNNPVNLNAGSSGAFRGDAQLSARGGLGSERFVNTGLSVGGMDNFDTKDPVGMMLSSTFRTTGMAESSFGSTQGRYPGSDFGRSFMDSAIDRPSRSTLPILPRGPGSGQIFDAGAQWMANRTAQVYKRKLTENKKKSKTLGADSFAAASESLVSGLRIPARLDSAQAVVFVLTQEAGKLKPKDLKIAIDRNRAEREVRAEEQERLRKQGGGVGMGLRGILAEQELNNVCGDLSKRQLREMAFIADVDDVRRQEAEKDFKVSEECVGCTPLTEEDIQEVLHQRQVLALRRKRAEWRDVQGRQHTVSYAPTHLTVKAGAREAILVQAASTLTPSFDSNRNDIWAKRMNTLRYFISIVTRWIIRRRAGLRLAKIQSRLLSVISSVPSQPSMSGCFQESLLMDCREFGGTLSGTSTSHSSVIELRRELVRAWVEEENSSNRPRGGVLPVPSTAPSSTVTYSRGSPDAADFSFEQCTTVAELVCAADYEPVVQRANSEYINSIDRFEMATHGVTQRVLFPKCIIEEGNALQTLKAESIESLVHFDDRSFFQLKVRPEYVAMRYTPHKVPELPLFFPTEKDRQMRTGAPEEYAQRHPADGCVSIQTVLSNMPPEPSGIAAMRTATAVTATALSSSSSSSVSSSALAAHSTTHAAPAWLVSEPADDEWTTCDLDYFRPRPDLRMYSSAPLVKETDPDWMLRPAVLEEGQLQWKDDDSIRTRWLKSPGFGSTNIYLLGGLERVTPNTPVPPPAMTLSHLYLPDLDRHPSGLQCLKNDHMRSLTGMDPDITPLQHKQAKADCLTDSESDEEDKYTAPIPSLRSARSLLAGKLARKKVVVGAIAEEKVTAKGGKAAKGSKAKPSAVVVAAPVVQVIEDTLDDFADVDEMKGEQVELMRDRKTLELEELQGSERRARGNAFTDRLIVLSKASQCLMQALPVQTAFKCYEAEAFAAFDKAVVDRVT